MPNPLNLYALGSCLAKFILVPAGRGQEAETRGMVFGLVCVPVCAPACMCTRDWRFTAWGASYQAPPAAHILAGKTLRNPNIFFCY